ncbi:hypothetical protein RhiirA5_503520 [Rhizophagus irregularis]|uniref:Restriction endonuclease domain-containing protein n=1 Tax=Rhizophagus irregularis TaxID=588596 RepID=A0A2N0P8Y2_9GLOM|nr:hypothetical protein RhiirA5_503520 [Rhizophagus irregularis]
MLFEGAQETRQAPHNYSVQKDDVVEINLPDELGMNEADAHVLEAIHSIYIADRIGNKLLFKYDGGSKKTIYRRLANSAEAFNPAWFVESNITCCVGRTELQPDVGIWIIPPTQAQCINPIVNRCPPPDVWIEVFFDRDPDRSNAINRINHCKRFRNGIEYVGIAIPETTRWHSNPAQASTAVVRQNNRPNQPPYGIMETHQFILHIPGTTILSLRVVGHLILILLPII